jgi:predicted nucleic acid-binding protein
VNDLRKGAPIIAASEPDLVSAMRIHQQHGFQFFDCLVVATAVRAGCTTLFSEDFHHTQVISALTILNPFKLRESELNKLLQ